MLVGYAGILACIAAIWIQRRQLTIGRLNFFVLLLALHVAASLFYCRLSLSAPADANGYYFDYDAAGLGPWHLGSIFVSKLCNLLRYGLGASYVGAFLFFQSFGFLGLLTLARIFSEIQHKCEVPEQPLYLLLLLVPSELYWTSAIGKDAPIFFAIALCAWAMLAPRRIVAFGSAILIMLLFRPYVALLAAFSFGLTSAFGSGVTAGRRLAIIAISVGGFVAISGAVLATFHFDATSMSSMIDFLRTQDAANASTLGTTSIAHLPIPMRFVSLLFRPFFFDAIGFLGMVASVENIASAICFAYLAWRWKDVKFLVIQVPFVRFILLFAFAIIVALALPYFNVGLGLRERVMTYPLIFSLLVGVWATRRRRKLAMVQDPHAMPAPIARQAAPGSLLAARDVRTF